MYFQAQFFILYICEINFIALWESQKIKFSLVVKPMAQHYGEQCGDSLKNWKQSCHTTHQSHCWPYTLRKPKWKDTCTPMFIAALFMIARAWKQPRCPLADEWIRKLWYVYTMDYYSAIKKNTFESVLTRWIKLEPIIQNEVSQKEKHQYSILMHIYRIQKDGNDYPTCKATKETRM